MRMMADPPSAVKQNSGSPPNANTVVKESCSLMSEETMTKRALKRKRKQEKWLAQKAARKEKKEAKKSTKQDPVNFAQDCLLETEYYFQNGLRKVYPYHFTYSTHAKGRWVKRRLLDIFAEEFRHDTIENYEKAIRSGKVRVNGDPIEPSYVLKDSDYIENVVHRHELPVTGDIIDVLVNDENVVVVNKPSSIPVHPCGRYRHNSLTFILDKDYGFKNLRTLYRLDRLTSGVMIFAKSEKVVKQMQDAIKNRQVQKEYLCRVVGKFPDGPQCVEEPLDVLSHKMGIFKVDPKGKASKTHFERVSYNGTTSLVRSKPHTGRTHQIRVHLQWLGHPIVNDPLYNTSVWGPERGKGGQWGKTEEQLVKDLLKHHTADIYAEKVILIPESSKSSPEAHSNVDLSGIAISSQTVIATPDGCLGTEEGTRSESNNSSSINSDSGAIGTLSSELKCTATPEEVKCTVIPEDVKCISTPEEIISPEEVRSTGISDEAPVQCTVTPEERKCTVTSQESKVVSPSLHIDRHPEPSTDCQGCNPGSAACGHHPAFDASKYVLDADCTFCHIVYEDPKPSQLVMYLHAYRYKGPDWEYSTPLPDWAHESWKEPDV